MGKLKTTEACLEFEKPIAALEKKLEDLREISKDESVDLTSEIGALEKKVSKLIDSTFSSLSPWQRVQLSRHPNRPYTRDYIENLFPDFKELAGDRCFSNDRAIMGGIASWPPVSPKQKPGKIKSASAQVTSVMIMGHQKGRTTKQKMLRSFGMARPEGYRKALRLMSIAERFKLPIVSLIDTPGAYPGIETEERGQAQAIAECIQHMFGLTVPVIAVVLGEGGSGGALAIGVANRVLMQEYSTYSVISPEGCASILWSDSRLAEKASERLKMGPQDLQQLGVIDAIVPEPKGGAHRDWISTFEKMRRALTDQMADLLKNVEDFRADRLQKFRKSGELAVGALGESE